MAIDETPTPSALGRGGANSEARWLGGISAASGLVGALIGGLFSYLVAHQQSTSQAQQAAKDYLRSQRQNIYTAYLRSEKQIVEFEFKVHMEALSDPPQASIDVPVAQKMSLDLDDQYSSLVLVASPGVLGSANAFNDAQRQLFLAPKESLLSHFRDSFQNAIQQSGDAEANLLTYARRDIDTLTEPAPRYTVTQYASALVTATATTTITVRPIVTAPASPSSPRPTK